MEIHIRFCSTPIDRPQPLPLDSPGAGARVEFYGTVRGTESGAGIRGLRYEIYESMAEKQILRILSDLNEKHPCVSVAVVHRMGEILVGEAAVYVGITSTHRAEGFSMLSAFMDRLKQEVPIWKAEVLPC
jgi:molybdopterin synthase catalytic subunit